MNIRKQALRSAILTGYLTFSVPVIAQETTVTAPAVPSTSPSETAEPKPVPAETPGVVETVVTEVATDVVTDVKDEAKERTEERYEEEKKKVVDFDDETQTQQQ